MTESRVVHTPRGWGLLAGGLAALTVGLLAVNLLLLLVGAIVVAFVLVDVLAFAWRTRGFRSSDLAVQRTENTALLPVGGHGTMATRIEVRRAAGFYLELYDRVPDGLVPVAGSPNVLSWVEARSTRTVAYVYRGTKRGALELGPVVAIAHDAFGLAFRTAVVEDRWPVEVLPDVALWKSEITERLRHEMVGRILAGPRGSGTEFRSLREYQPEDDFRSIVWKRSTYERLLVKENETENRLDIALVLDVSRPMGQGPPGGEALDLAVDAALLLARYAFSQGDRTALLLWADGARKFLPLGRTVDHAFEIDRTLSAAVVVPGKFEIEDAAQFLARNLGHPSAVFAFAALDPPPDLTRGGLSAFRGAGHRLFLHAPDPLALFPPLPDPLAERAVRFAADPLVALRHEAARRLREAGVTTQLFGRSDLIDQVTRGYAGVRFGVVSP
ncbi:MAG TPA: DUF58 domain-containing protein [Thermoplasmata archaeon]|nr:DUF58 domain-containing protein [Thermoplasmata archaeon]